MRGDRLSKTEVKALNRAWEILSRYVEAREERLDKEGRDVFDDYLTSNAMTACAGLCEFVNNYEE